MDMEQLKLIMQTLATMGEAGKDAFVWWLVLDKVLPVVGWLLTFGGLMWVAMRLIARIGPSSLGEQVRDVLGIGSPGSITDSEARETILRVRELMKNRRDA